MSANSDAHEVSGTITGAVVGYVRRAVGERGVVELLERAGETRAIQELEDESGWSGREQALRLLAAAAEVTGDPEVARRIGEDMLFQRRASEVTALLRSLGSPAAVMEQIALAVTKFSTAIRMQPREVLETTAVIEAWLDGPQPLTPQECQLCAGLLSQVGPLFGLPTASVAVEHDEPGEESRRCTFVVSWEEDSDLAGRVLFLEEQLVSLAERFEALRDTAIDVVSGESLDDMLEALVRRAGLAVRAPRFLLAVRVEPDAPTRIHHLGFSSPTVAEELGERLVVRSSGSSLDPQALDVEPIAAGEALVVEVASLRRRFGAIAAFAGPGGGFFAQERQLLTAYAGHAAALLELAAALEEARREASTAHALLELAGYLAEVTSPEEMARRIAHAVPQVLSCDATGVFSWDHDRSRLDLLAAVRFEAGGEVLPGGFTIGADDTPLILQLREEPRARFVSPRLDDGFVRDLMQRLDVASAVLVPISSHGEFLGVIAVARTRQPIPRDEDMLKRLGGIAAHAANAMANARLVQAVRSQALHDPLTGLPNMRLLRERAGAALAQARRGGEQVGVLFIDLDGFKPVNDRFGHAAGDEVLRVCGRRLEALTREADTLARVGGDEFAVLIERMPSTEHCAELASRLLRAFAPPFTVAGQEVRLTASIGGAAFPLHGADIDELLRSADAAMYEAKSRGRGEFHLAGSG